MRRTKLIAIVLTLMIALGVSPVFAIDQPDTISVDSARAFADVIESGDFLFIAQFAVSYEDCNSATTTGCPSETITESFLGHLIDGDGSTVLRSSTTALSAAHSFNGYGAGVFSIYVNATDAATLGIVTSTDNSLRIAGQPVVFGGSPPSSTLRVSAESAASVVGTHILNRALNLENSWDIALLTSSDNKLNSVGADYFVKAVPDLRLISPNIFGANIDSMQFLNDKEFNSTTRDDFVAFGSGFQFIDNYEAQFDLAETAFGTPKTLVKTVIALAITAFAILMVTRATDDPRIGALAFPIIFPVGVVLGFGVLEFVMIATLFAAIGIAWIVFLKSA